MLLLAFIVAMGIQYLLFLPAYLFKTDKLTDLSYGLTFIILTLLFVEKTPGKLLLAAMIILWGLRLATYLVIRIRKIGRDKRFDGMRESLPRFLGFWTLQGVSVFAIMLCSLLYFSSGTRYSVAGIAVFLAGLTIEAVADQQKYTFANRKTGKWIATGLWKYSRHPNYLGEMLCWIGIYLFALPGLGGIDRWIALISPLFIVVLLLFVSGIPLLERRADEKWGKDKKYLEYKKRTGVLLPRLW